VSRRRLAAGAVAAAVAGVCAAAIAHDATSWRDALSRGDEVYAQAPQRARWSASAWFPGDPAGTALHTSQDVQLRRAVQLFVVAVHARRGFDAGETRARVRSAAEAALTAIAVDARPSAASQANDLLGVLQGIGTDPAADELAVASFQTAIRADPSNLDAKVNLELALRRLRATSVRQGPGTGSGPRSSGRRGAGSGTPGRGY
jgi:hypothetical protein